MGPKKPYFQVIDGVQRCPNLTPAVFRESLTYRAREGDVILSSFPLAGAKWVQYLIQLIFKHGEPIRSYEEFARGVRSIDHTNAREWKSVLPMRLFSTRMPLQRDMMNPEAKYVCVVRNPWDSCVSFFHRVTDLSNYRFQDGTFDEFFDSYLEDSFGLQSYIDVVAEGYALKDEPNVFFVTYEELHKDTRAIVLRLSYFLGEQYAGALKGDTSLLEKILEQSTADRMRDVMVVTMRPKPDGSTVTSKTGYRGDHSRYTMVRSARVGEWKEYMSPHHLRRLEAKLRQAGQKAAFMSLWEAIRAETAGVSGSDPN